jgi:osmoprotectant transport system ATP-binding protein
MRNGKAAMIRLEHIGKHYNGVAALADVTLDIEPGRFVVLIGPSGCGKSTLLRIINRMIEPDAGRLFIGGKDALHLDPVQLRRSIGYVIQNVGLFPHLTVRENVEVVPRLLGWDKGRQRRRAEEVLSLVRLEPQRFGDRYPKELSGGQQQRVGIARALAADPDVLLMDEPFSAVDPITRDQLQEEMIRIQTSLHKTIVFVTHDIDEAVRLADRVCLMREGRIVQYADPDTLLLSPADHFAALFVGQERELKRLGRHSVADFMQPHFDDASIETAERVPLHASARTALSKLLGGQRSLIVVDGAGVQVGSVSLGDFARVP